MKLSKLAIAMALTLIPLISQATCIEGNYSVPLGQDNTGKSGTAKFQFKLETPTNQTPGHFKSELLNGEESFVGTTPRGKQLSKVSDAITPDDLVMVESPFTLRCPCISVDSDNGKVSLVIENQGSGEMHGRFLKYFNVGNVYDIKMTDLKECE